MPFLKHATGSIKQIVPKVEKAALFCPICEKVIDANGDKKCPFCSSDSRSKKSSTRKSA